MEIPCSHLSDSPLNGELYNRIVLTCVLSKIPKISKLALSTPLLISTAQPALNVPTFTTIQHISQRYTILARYSPPPTTFSQPRNDPSGALFKVGQSARAQIPAMYVIRLESIWGFHRLGQKNQSRSELQTQIRATGLALRQCGAGEFAGQIFSGPTSSPRDPLLHRRGIAEGSQLKHKTFQSRRSGSRSYFGHLAIGIPYHADHHHGRDRHLPPHPGRQAR